MKKKLIILSAIILLLLVVGTLLFFIFKSDQNLKTNNSSEIKNYSLLEQEENVEVNFEEKEDVSNEVKSDNNDKKVEDDSSSKKEDSVSQKKEDKTQASQSSSNIKNNSSNNSQSKPQNNNQTPTETKKEESDSNVSNDSNPVPKKEVDTTTYVVDTNDIFYPIHKGTSDYSDSSTCYNKGIEMSFKYPSIISYYNCIDVMSINIATGNRKIMGYYLEYIFADTTYDSLDDCNNKGNALKKDLSSKFSSFKCQKESDNYILKIK